MDGVPVCAASVKAPPRVQVVHSGNIGVDLPKKLATGALSTPDLRYLSPKDGCMSSHSARREMIDVESPNLFGDEQVPLKTSLGPELGTKTGLLPRQRI